MKEFILAILIVAGGATLCFLGAQVFFHFDVHSVLAHYSRKSPLDDALLRFWLGLPLLAKISIPFSTITLLVLYLLGKYAEQRQEEYDQWMFGPWSHSPPFADLRDWNETFANDQPPQEFGVHGQSRYALFGEVARAKGFALKGIPLGFALDRTGTRFKNYWGPPLRHDNDGHILLCARSGAGKATDTQIPMLLAPWDTGGWIVVDPKGQLADVTYPARNINGVWQCGTGEKFEINRHAYYLNPCDKFGNRLGTSIKYNPMRATLDPKSRSYGLDCDSLSDALNLETGGDKHWTEGSKVFCSGIVMFFRKYRPVEEQNLSSVRLAIAGPNEVLESIIDEAIATGDILIIERLARFASFAKNDDREARSIISTARVQTSFISNDYIRESLKGDFKFSKLRTEKGAAVFLILPGEYLDTCSKWFRLVVASAMRELMAANEGERVTFMLDEFAQLGRLGIFETAIALARGYKIRLMPVLQDLNQLRELYKDRWETFLANTTTQIFYGSGDHFTTEYLSKLCGSRTVMGVSHNTSTSITTSTSTGQSGANASANESNGVSTSTSTSNSPMQRPLLLPEEIRGLPSHQALIFMAGVPHPIDAGRYPYWRPGAGLQRLYRRDPYYTGRTTPDFAPEEPVQGARRLYG